jgi:hypothetical protein
MQWEPPKNPYRLNAFRILQLGAGATPAQIVAQSSNLGRRISAGTSLKIGGESLDLPAVTQAAATLRDPATLAEELLLVHNLR